MRRPDGSSAEVVGLYAGRVARLRHGRTTVPSAVVKSRIDGAALLTVDGLVGDEQGDRVNHGGPDKALLVCAVEHYADRGSPAFGLPVASLGENVSTRGLTETQVRVGDVLTLGDALVQVSQPRRPCYKMGARHRVRELPVRMQDAGHTGYYLRVLQPGAVRAGQRLRLERRADHDVSVAEVNRVLNVDKRDLAGVELVLAAGDDLPARWRETLERRLAERGGQHDESARLYGTTAPTRPAVSDRTDRANTADRSNSPDTANRADRADRADRPDRSDRSDTADRVSGSRPDDPRHGS